jgi:hypothetical protein
MRFWIILFTRNPSVGQWGMDSNNHETPQIAEGFRVFFAPSEKSRTGYAALRSRAAGIAAQPHNYF